MVKQNKYHILKVCCIWTFVCIFSLVGNVEAISSIGDNISTQDLTVSGNSIMSGNLGMSATSYINFEGNTNGVTSFGFRNNAGILQYKDSGGSWTNIKDFLTSTTGLLRSELGANSGVASLDAGGKLPTSQLPDSILGSVNYQGTWNANTNDPTIPAAATANKGYYYRVSTVGTTDIDGTTDWQVGDWIISDGTAWAKVDNTEPHEISFDTTPQLGGHLDVNGFSIGDGTDELLKFSETASAVNEFTIKNAATTNAPELQVTGTDSDIDLKLVPKGTGKVVLSGMSFPAADGTSGQYLKTNGSGELSWATPGGGLSDSLTDNTADAWDIQQGTDNYLNINTTDSSEAIGFGNATTNPAFNFLGSGVAGFGGDISVNGGNITLGANGQDGELIIFSEEGVSDQVLRFHPNADMTQDVTLTFPADDGSASQVLTTDGNGALSWSTPAGGLSGTLTDNTADAWDIQEGSNNYININTTDSSEAIAFGNATTNPGFSFFGTGAAGFGGDITSTGDIAVNGGNITLGTNGQDGELVIYSEEGASDQVLKFIPNTDMTQDVTLTFPADDGTSGQFLRTDGSGVLSWVTAAAGVTQLSDLSDVNTSTATAGNFLVADGVDFESVALSGDATLSGAGALSLATNSVDDNEINYTNVTLADFTNDAGFLTTSLTDNTTDALDFQQGTDNYINVNTTDASEAIAFGNATTNPSFSFLGSGNATFSGDIAVDGGSVTAGVDGQDGSLTIYSEQGATDYSVVFQPSAAMTQTTTYTFPADDGTSSQVLTTNGSGALSWSTVAGGVTQLSDLSDVNTSTATAGNFLVADGVDFESVALSGDATLSGAGALSLATNSVDDNEINYTNVTLADFTNDASFLTTALTDNTTDSFDLQQGTDNYINVNTTDASEAIAFGNATTNPSFSFLGSGNATFSGDIAVDGGSVTAGVDGQDGSLTIYSEQGVTDYSVVFQPNAAMTHTTTYTLPADDGTSSQVLTTNGSGVLSWTTAAGGGLSATLTDNTTDAWDIQEGTNNYININTTDSSENISLGNATTNPSFSFLGSGNVTTAGDIAVDGGSATLGVDGQDGSMTIYSEQGGTDYSVVLQPNAAMTQTTTYTLPPNDGSTYQTLHTDGSGALTWGSTNLYASSTGVIEGGTLTINADTTKFDMAQVRGLFVDRSSDPDNPTVTEVTCPAQTAVTATYLASNAGTFIGINSSCVIVQQVTDFTENQLSTILRLGRLSHFGRTVLTGTYDFPLTVETNPCWANFVMSQGTIKTSGAEISAGGVDLSLDRTAGTFIRIGAGSSRETQNSPSIGAETTFDILPTHNNSGDSTVIGASTTQIDTTYYDDANAALQTFTNNKYGNYFILFFPYKTTDTTMGFRGDREYASLAEAVEGARNQNYIINSDIDGGIILAAISFQEGVTNLTSAISGGTAHILNFGMFGGAGTAGSSGGITHTLQVIYDQSTEPEIITDATRGAFNLRRGSAADTDNVFVVENGAGTLQTSIKGNGNLEVGGALTTGINGEDGSLTIYSEQGVTDYSVVFQPNAAMTQTTTYTLPANDGDASQVLQTNGSGVLSWATAGGASSLTDLSDVNTATVTAGNFLVADGVDFESVAMSGDATLAASGAISLATNSVDDNEINYNNVTLADFTNDAGFLTASLTDNTANALDFQQGTNNYININTTDASEAIAFGNATTNPSFSFLGSGTTTLTGALAVNGDSITADGATLTINAAGAVDIQDNVTADALTLDTGDLTFENGELITNDTDGTIAFTDGTNTLFSVVDAGTTGNISSTGNITANGGSITAGVDGQDGSLTIYSEQGGTDYSVVFQPNAAMTQATTYTLPANDGDASQVLTTNGAGVLSWAAAGGVSSLTDLSDVNTATVTAGNFLVADGVDFESVAMSGDATMAASGAVTIANNSVDGTDIALGSDAQGDIMYYNGTDWVRLAAGTSGQVLQTNGAGANPSWATASGGGAHYAYGSLGVEGNSTETTISTIDTYTKVSATTTAGNLLNFTHTNNRLTYTGTETKVFQLSLNASFETAASNQVAAFAIFKNGTKEGYEVRRKASAGDVGALGLHADFSLAQNDYIELYVKNETSTGNFTVDNFYFFLSTIN